MFWKKKNDREIDLAAEVFSVIAVGTGGIVEALDILPERDKALVLALRLQTAMTWSFLLAWLERNPPRYDRQVFLRELRACACLGLLRKQTGYSDAEYNSAWQVLQEDADAIVELVARWLAGEKVPYALTKIVEQLWKQRFTPEVTRDPEVLELIVFTEKVSPVLKRAMELAAKA